MKKTSAVAKAMADKPLVSVIMPVHNAGRFLAPAIESIVGQTYPRLELIIIDDGSTDTSWDIITQFRKTHPKIIKAFRNKTKQNEAGNAATNLGLLYAKGAYIARMDADDIALPTRIAKQVDYLSRNPDTILVGTQAKVINQHGKIIGKKSMPLTHDAIYNQYGFVHPIIHPSVMINRALLPNPNVLYACKYGINDDYYTFFTLLSHGKFANLPEALLKYRVHTNNSSLNNLKRNYWNINAIRIEAITKLNYHAPLTVFPIMLAQSIVVAMLPETVLRELFYYVRGIKKITFNINIPVYTFAKLKSYAATFLA